MKTNLLPIALTTLAVFTYLALPARATLIIQDDFSQPDSDNGSHSPYNVYGVDLWDGAPGGAGLSPTYQTTPGHTNPGVNLPGGVWRFGGGGNYDWDAGETGNLAGYGLTPLYLTGGEMTGPGVAYAHLHDNENIAITTGTYNIDATITVTVSIAPAWNAILTGPGYAGFDSALNTANNFSGLELDSAGGLSLIVAGSQVGPTVPFTGSFSGSTATQLSFTVDTTSGAISNITLQGSASAYNFTTTAFTAAATHYVAFYVPSGGTAGAAYAGLSVTSTPSAGGTGGGGNNNGNGGGGTYGNLSVTGTADLQGDTTYFGSWSEGGGLPGLTLNYVDGNTATVQLIASGNTTAWQWWDNNGSASHLSMALDQGNQLSLFKGTSGVAGVTLSPSGASNFAGDVNFSGNITVTGTGNAILIPPAGDLSMGPFTHGAPPPQ